MSRRVVVAWLGTKGAARARVMVSLGSGTTARPRWRLSEVEARASSSYSSSGHLAGPGEVELRLEEQQTDWSFAGVAQGAPGLGRALGHTLGNPAGTDGYSDIHSHGGTSDMADTSWHETACLNMKRLLILSVTKELMLFGFHWNFIS